MVYFLRYSLIAVVVMVSMISVRAQELYTTEAGVYGGASYFSGDAGKKTLSGMQADYGLTLRYVFNQRIALHADLHQLSAAGTYGSHYPAVYPGQVKVNNPASALDMTVAFNFFDYGYLDHVMYSSNITPYLFAGVGGIYFRNGNTGEKFGFTIPFGIGMKMKLSPRMHLNLQWTHRLLTSRDNLEGNREMNDPLYLNGSNRLNNDQAGSLSIGISIGLSRRNCDCHNYQ